MQIFILKQANKYTKGVKLKTNKAITLIALIITIIVLLILAGVTISLTLGENGIFKTAEMAGKNYTQAQEQELAGLAGFENTINNIIGGTGNSDTDTPEVTGQLLKEVAKPGDYVKYDTGISTVGEEGIVIFRILYNNSEHGLQIISDGNIEKLSLGGDDWPTARDSYNNAIATLNQRAEYYATSSPYALDGRCVGSVPTVGTDGKFNAKNTENVGPVKSQFISSSAVEGIDNMKDTDQNYVTDSNTIENLEKAGIFEEVNGYWLASRYADSYDVYCSFIVRFTDKVIGDILNFPLCHVLTSGSGALYSRGLRPCISLNPDVKIVGGDGSEETPFELSL